MKVTGVEFFNTVYVQESQLLLGNTGSRSHARHCDNNALPSSTDFCIDIKKVVTWSTKHDIIN